MWMTDELIKMDTKSGMSLCVKDGVYGITFADDSSCFAEIPGGPSEKEAIEYFDNQVKYINSKRS